MGKFFSTLVVLLILISGGYATFRYWPYIFSKNITGVISDVQRVTPPAVVVGGGENNATAREMFSFAIAIKQKNGEIATASSEDRQWAVAKPGQCVEAKFFPYPPWKIENAGTYYGARLVRLYVCEEGRLVDPNVMPEAPVPSAEGQ
ncbi:MAG: hypothetical protein KDD38_00930 [Bdellovibrionales bacterium]|nr:hypothetical protein [Bdellovibrionales bacterium]